MSTTEAYKNIIFVTGHPSGEFRNLAKELTLHLYKSVFISHPHANFHHCLTMREVAMEKSLFYSQAFFYGSLPSRKNVVIAVPELNMRTILQFIMMFEKVKKNVFVVVDDRYFISSLTKQKFQELASRLPANCSIFASEFISSDDISFFGLVEKIKNRIFYNAKCTNESDLKDFNDILSAIPRIFRDEIKKSIFGSEFGDVPFNQLIKNLLPEFNDTDTEDIEKTFKKLKIESRKIPEFFKPIPKQAPPTPPPQTLPPPSLNIQESEDDQFISLLDVFPVTDNSDESLKLN